MLHVTGYYQPAGPLLQTMQGDPCCMPSMPVPQPQVKVLVHNTGPMHRHNPNMLPVDMSKSGLRDLSMHDRGTPFSMPPKGMDLSMEARRTPSSVAPPSSASGAPPGMHANMPLQAMHGMMSGPSVMPPHLDVGQPPLDYSRYHVPPGMLSPPRPSVLSVSQQCPPPLPPRMSTASTQLSAPMPPFVSQMKAVHQGLPQQLASAPRSSQAQVKATSLTQQSPHRHKAASHSQKEKRQEGKEEEVGNKSVNNDSDYVILNLDSIKQDKSPGGRDSLHPAVPLSESLLADISRPSTQPVPKLERLSPASAPELSRSADSPWGNPRGPTGDTPWGSHRPATSGRSSKQQERTKKQTGKLSSKEDNAAVMPPGKLEECFSGKSSSKWEDNVTAKPCSKREFNATVKPSNKGEVSVTAQSSSKRDENVMGVTAKSSGKTEDTLPAEPSNKEEDSKTGRNVYNRQQIASAGPAVTHVKFSSKNVSTAGNIPVPASVKQITGNSQTVVTSTLCVTNTNGNSFRPKVSPPQMEHVVIPPDQKIEYDCAKLKSTCLTPKGDHTLNTKSDGSCTKDSAKVKEDWNKPNPKPLQNNPKAQQHNSNSGKKDGNPNPKSKKEDSSCKQKKSSTVQKQPKKVARPSCLTDKLMPADKLTPAGGKQVHRGKLSPGCKATSSKVPQTVKKYSAGAKGTTDGKVPSGVKPSGFPGARVPTEVSVGFKVLTTSRLSPGSKTSSGGKVFPKVSAPSAVSKTSGPVSGSNKPESSGSKLLVASRLSGKVSPTPRRREVEQALDCQWHWEGEPHAKLVYDMVSLLLPSLYKAVYTVRVCVCACSLL